jgi:hypothetical protein
MNRARRRSRPDPAATLRVAVLALALAAPAQAQSSLLPWTTIDAGGGLVANAYTLDGSVGQHDAGTPQVGGTYQLRGGFWRGAVSIGSRLIFADGFDGGDSTHWTDTVPFGFEAAGVVARPESRRDLAPPRR